jgi:hypothetical protein
MFVIHSRFPFTAILGDEMIVFYFLSLLLDKVYVSLDQHKLIMLEMNL